MQPFITFTCRMRSILFFVNACVVYVKTVTEMCRLNPPADVKKKKKKGGWNIRKKLLSAAAQRNLQPPKWPYGGLSARHCTVFLLWIPVVLHQINRSNIYSSHPTLHQLHVTLTPPLYLLHWHRFMSHRLQGVKIPHDEGIFWTSVQQVSASNEKPVDSLYE